MREKIYNIIEPRGKETMLSGVYDTIMITVIILSLIPLLFKSQNVLFDVFEKIAVTIFIIDYILRLLTADYYYKEHSVKSFVRYPFSPFAIIDLLSILPAIVPLHPSFKTLRLLRLLMALRVIRFLRYAKTIRIISNVFSKQKDALLAVLGFAFGYDIVTAIIMFQIEPHTFGNFFDALYWATVSLTTVGYGDIVAATPMGRLFTIISTFVGIAIIALPAGIITAGYVEELRLQSLEEEEERGE